MAEALLDGKSVAQSIARLVSTLEGGWLFPQSFPERSHHSCHIGRHPGVLLLLLGTVVAIFNVRTLYGCSGRCSRGSAAGGKPPARFVTQPTPTTARARAQAAVGTGGASARTMISRRARRSCA